MPLPPRHLPARQAPRGHGAPAVPARHRPPHRNPTTGSPHPPVRLPHRQSSGLTAAQTVRFWDAAHPQHTVSVMLGDAQPKITDGYGKIVLTDRPGRVTLTDWDGGTPLQMTVPIQFENWAAHRTVQPAVDRLIALARRPHGDSKPPIVHAASPALPVRSTVRWWIENLEWGDYLRDERTGALLRQPVVVTLHQATGEHLLHVGRAYRQPAERKRRRTSAQLAQSSAHKAIDLGRKPKRHRVKARETLLSVAASAYGDPGLWTVVAEANGLRSPTGLVEGQEITVP